MSTLQIEEGKFYRTRDGRKVGPASKDSGASSHPFTCQQGKYQFLYTPAGKLYSSGEESENDLVAEWQDAPATVEPDLHEQLLDAERRREATHETSCTALHVLCKKVGLSVADEKKGDFPFLFDLISGWVGQQASSIEKDPTDGGYYTTVLVPTRNLGEISYALSDLACWARGFRAALPRNEFGVRSEDEPMGTWAVTEINIALKRALEKNA